MSSNLPAQVRDTIRKHHLLLTDDPVLVGVSGGADSVALAVVLRELGYDIAIGHVNHGLRGQDSDNDEVFTQRLAERLHVRFFSRKVVLIGGNIEEAGRDARKDFYNEVAAEHHFNKVALAHTLSDRVETFLLNLFRGAGSTGLGAMAAITGTIVRPLIESTREDIELYLTEKGEEWRTDASNYDLTFTRNRLRHKVIPDLSAEFNPNLQATLSRTTEILETEDSWMRSVTEDWLRKHGTKRQDGFVISVKALQSVHVALIRRVIRTAVHSVASELRDMTFDHIDSVRALLEDGKSGKYVQLPGGIQIAREFNEVVVRKAPSELPDYEYELQIPGSVHIRELGQVFNAELVDSETREGRGPCVFVDGDSVGPCVRIRNWKPGDYYKPVGLPAGKLKKLFQRARIPRSHRKSWPVVVADSTIVWVASFPVSRDFVPGGRSQKIVAIEAVHLGDNLA